MASPVRISEKLISEVVDNVIELYKWFLEDVEKQKPDVGDRIFDLLYGPYQSAMDKLPATFFCMRSRIDVRSIDGEALNYGFNLSSVRLGGYAHPPGGDIEPTDYGDKVNIKRTPYTEEICDVVLSWRQRKEDIRGTRDRSISAVKKILRNSKSLAPAIKAFPPLIDLIPPDTRKKIDVPQHRLSSVQMELDPDLKKLASDIAVKKLFNR